MNVDCFIINDFLDHPDGVRYWIIDNNKKGHLPFDRKGSYPGIRTDRVGNKDYHYMIEEIILQGGIDFYLKDNFLMIRLLIL